MKVTKTRLVLLIVVIALLAGIVILNVRSPTIMSVQSGADLQNSVISYSLSAKNVSIGDGSGNYSFRFGLDYPDTPIQRGASTVFKVYATLTSEQIFSGFTRGVSLQVDSVSLLVDNVSQNGVKLETTTNPSLLTELFEFGNISLPAGTHSITARLILSTLDVDYVGYFEGSTRVVELNGTIVLQ